MHCIMQRKAKGMTQEIVQRSLFNDDELRSIQSWDDLKGLLAEKELTVAQAHEILGNGFELLSKDEKAKLVDVPFMILDWRFNIGDMGTFVSLTIAAQNPDKTMRKVIINDGSTGICAQIETLANRGITPPVFVAKGLVRSDYDYEVEDKNGETVKRPATTYYLSESA